VDGWRGCCSCWYKLWRNMMFLCGCGVRVMWCMLVPWPCAFGSLFCSFSAPRIVSYLCPFVRFFCVDTIS
jgi:hypothetical protein